MSDPEGYGPYSALVTFKTPEMDGKLTVAIWAARDDLDATEQAKTSAFEAMKITPEQIVEVQVERVRRRTAAKRKPGRKKKEKA